MVRAKAGSSQPRLAARGGRGAVKSTAVLKRAKNTGVRGTRLVASSGRGAGQFTAASGRASVAEHGAAATTSYEAALLSVPRGETATFCEIGVLATGHTAMGAMIHAGRTVRLVPTESRRLPWWRVVSAGKRTVEEALQRERAKQQRALLSAEGVGLTTRLERDPSHLPSFLASAYALREILPASPHTCTLVYLHGFSFTGSYYAARPHFFKAARAHGLRVVLPTAPPPPSRAGRLVPTMWFSGWPPSLEDLEAPRAALLALLRRETARLGGRSDRVFLGGSSQGCIVGLDLYLRCPMPLGGFCGVIGRWPACSDDLLRRGISRELIERPVRLFNGAADRTIEWEPAKRSFEKLKRAGFSNLRSEVFPGVVHRVGEREGLWIRTFLDEVLT
eukprot:NODE_9266_length_1436_cov_5.161956.p1 GENE.NODE_9266_length_1436_cov_5.161956~~NODE_9266_length_1436_cov_5.161956.p1  ORF type:complete len:391 (-),score=70.40 NODE_9266_length_1436_cov_5.161956:186-1358(-)